MHPLSVRRPQCHGVSILQILGQPVTIGIRGPASRLLIVGCEHNRRSVQLTRSMPRERRRRSVDASLRQDDRATSCCELPGVCQRQCHQILRRRSFEQVVAPAVDAIVHAHSGYSVHAGIGSRRDGRVPDGGIRRKGVDPRPSEPGAALAQGGERRHGAGVLIEVIPAHAIQDEEHDHSRSGKRSPQHRQTRPVAVGGICTPRAAARVGATSCCAAGIEYSPVLTAGPANMSGIETSYSHGEPCMNTTSGSGRVIKSPSRGTMRSWPVRPGKYARANMSRNRCRTAWAAASADATRGVGRRPEKIAWPAGWKSAKPSQPGSE